MDREGKSRVQVSEKGSIHYMAGQWINNEEVLYATFSGEIFRADRSGQKQRLVKTGRANIKNTHLLGDHVYYTTLQDEWVDYNLKTNQTHVVKKNVISVVPSPDQKRLALVVRQPDNLMALLLTDLQGKQLAKLNEALEIYGVSWSPDQQKLSYILSSQSLGKQGLFVTEMRSKRAVQLTADIYQIIAPIKWDDSSKRMMFTSVGRRNLSLMYLT